MSIKWSYSTAFCTLPPQYTPVHYNVRDIAPRHVTRWNEQLSWEHGKGLLLITIRLVLFISLYAFVEFLWIAQNGSNEDVIILLPIIISPKIEMLNIWGKNEDKREHGKCIKYLKIIAKWFLKMYLKVKAITAYCYPLWVDSHVWKVTQ